MAAAANTAVVASWPSCGGSNGDDDTSGGLPPFWSVGPAISAALLREAREVVPILEEEHESVGAALGLAPHSRGVRGGEVVHVVDDTEATAEHALQQEES